jgi:hypothetical protein
VLPFLRRLLVEVAASRHPFARLGAISHVAPFRWPTVVWAWWASQAPWHQIFFGELRLQR